MKVFLKYRKQILKIYLVLDFSWIDSGCPLYRPGGRTRGPGRGSHEAGRCGSLCRPGRSCCRGEGKGGPGPWSLGRPWPWWRRRRGTMGRRRGWSTGGWRSRRRCLTSGGSSRIRIEVISGSWIGGRCRTWSGWVCGSRG